jgi:hypothetical protein
VSVSGSFSQFLCAAIGAGRPVRFRKFDVSCRFGARRGGILTEFVFANFVVMPIAVVSNALSVFSRHMMIMAGLAGVVKVVYGVTVGRNFVLRQK